MRRRWLMLAAVVLVALNLRGPIAAVSPVATDIGDALSAAAGVTGLLTALPVLCFALVSPGMAALAGITGTDRAILLGLAGIAAGTLLRSSDGLVAAIAGTVLIGVSITAGNVLVPVVIKRDFPQRAAVITGVYTASLAAGAALTAGLTVPIAAQTGWRWALAVWALLAVLAAVVWAVVFHRSREPAGPAAPTATVSVWRSRTAWAVAGFLGCQAALYYSVTAWLPTLLADTAGLGAGTGGAALSLYQFVGIAGTLSIPALVSRSVRPSALAGLIGGAWVTTLTGLLAAPALWPVWSTLGGLAQGGGISLAFTLIILRSRTVREVRSLSGMAQGVGYTLAAAGPFVVGAIHDATAGWTPPLLFLLVVDALLVVTGVAAGRDRYSA